MDEERPIVAMNREEDGNYVLGYMCGVDYECELGAASGGNTVFPSAEDLRQHMKCVEQCGIVEVEVRYRRIVQRPKWD